MQDLLVKGLVLLNDKGQRVAAKYYCDEYSDNAKQLAFEKLVFNKTKNTKNARSEAEIGLFDGNIVVFKFVGNLFFYVVGGEDENELVLAMVLEAFFDAVSMLLRDSVDKRTALENFGLILLCIDEIVDRGIILETDPSAIYKKVSTRSPESELPLPLSEQTISQAFASATDLLTRSLLS